MFDCTSVASLFLCSMNSTRNCVSPVTIPGEVIKDQPSEALQAYGLPPHRFYHISRQPTADSRQHTRQGPGPGLRASPFGDAPFRWYHRPCTANVLTALPSRANPGWPVGVERARVHVPFHNGGSNVHSTFSNSPLTFRILVRRTAMVQSNGRTNPIEEREPGLDRALPARRPANRVRGGWR